MGSWSGEDTWQGGVGGGSGLVRWQLVDQCRQGGGWQTRQSHICVQINREEQLGSKTSQPRVPMQETKASKPLAVKSCGGCRAVKTPSFTGEFVEEIHGVLECTQTHPPTNQHQKAPICLWIVEEVTESQLRAEPVTLFSLGPLPHIRAPQGSNVGCPALVNT